MARIEKDYRRAVVYQIYVKSFCDSDGDGLGDLPGIIGKLDYLERLGVDYLWLTPFFPSPQHDNGYDVSDYCAVDPRYGTMADFDELVAKAAEKGDALMREYTQTLIEYIDYYLRFDGVLGDMVTPLFDEKLDQLGDAYYLAVYAGRRDVVDEINEFYRSLGIPEEHLVNLGDELEPLDTTAAE